MTGRPPTSPRPDPPVPYAPLFRSGSAPGPASSASVAIGSAFGLAAPAMKASAAASSIGDLGLLLGLRAIAIEIHSAIIMLYKYRADQCGQLVDRLGVT